VERVEAAITAAEEQEQQRLEELQRVAGLVQRAVHLMRADGDVDEVQRLLLSARQVLSLSLSLSLSLCVCVPFKWSITCAGAFGLNP
jgi:hypothetical protein